MKCSAILQIEYIMVWYSKIPKKEDKNIKRNKNKKLGVAVIVPIKNAEAPENIPMDNNVVVISVSIDIK